MKYQQAFMGGLRAGIFNEAEAEPARKGVNIYSTTLQFPCLLLCYAGN